MDDESKHYTIQVKGAAYRFAPLTPEGVTTVSVVNAMGVGPDKVLKALMRVLAASAGPEQWDELTDRLIESQITVQDLAGVFKRLAERQAKDADQPRGLDVASTELRPSGAA